MKEEAITVKVITPSSGALRVVPRCYVKMVCFYERNQL